MHVAATFGPGRMALYLQGQIVTLRTDAPTSMIENAKPFRVGCAASSNHFANVALSDVRLFSRVLTDVEIAALAK